MIHLVKSMSVVGGRVKIRELVSPGKVMWVVGGRVTVLTVMNWREDSGLERGLRAD